METFEALEGRYYLPLKSNIPFSVRKPDRIYYMLRGYFDGSGKIEDSEYVTLTGLIASESVWERFERSWAEVLQKYRISDFHMSEAISLNDRFSRENGWDRKKVNELIND